MHSNTLSTLTKPSKGNPETLRKRMDSYLAARLRPNRANAGGMGFISKHVWRYVKETLLIAGEDK